MEQNQQFQPQPPVFDQQQVPQPQYYPGAQARPMLKFGEACKIFWSKSLDFTGRARRSEYWWGMLSLVIIAIVWYIIAVVIVTLMMKGAIADMDVFDDDTILRVFMPKILLFSSPILLLWVPGYAAMTRRLHDVGRSGWWIAIYFVFQMIYLAGMAYMVALLTKSEDSFDGLSYGFIGVVAVAYIVTLVLGIVLFVFTLLDSKPEENKYGPSPKYQ